MDATAKRSDVTVTLECNNRCVFCPRTVLRHIAVGSRRGLLERLDRVRQGSDRVVLTGGEVTILPDFLRIVARCRKRGFREIAVVSNGRRLSDPVFAKRTVDAGVTEICITLYDLRPRVHDGLTGVQGSLAETLKGLDNVLKISSHRKRPLVRINTILTAENAGGMARLVKDMAGRGIRSILIADAVLSGSFRRPLPYSRAAKIAGRIAEGCAGGVASVVFRGFPTCIFRRTPGVTAESSDRPGSVRFECQNIDTAFLPKDEVDRYFDEFYSNFVRIDACRPCSARRSCPGIQKLYLESMGPAEFAPLPSPEPPAPRRKAGAETGGGAGEPPELAGELIEERRDPGRIAVTPTTACQLRCSYCQVRLGRRRSPAEVLDRAVDLLATTSSKRPELQFFGGEPLLRWQDVKRAIERADRAHAGLGILHTITTNGLLLGREVLDFLKDRRSKVIFSMDGDLGTQSLCRFRAARDAARLQALMEKNLDRLMASGIPFFVNMVFTPETLPMLEKNADYLVRRGVKTLQACYANGIVWSEEDARRAASTVASLARRSLASQASGGGFRLQNLGSRVEPATLSNDLLVDVDGTLYGDAALFCEKALPGLRDPYRLGHVGDLVTLDGLRRTKGENLRILRRTYPAGSTTAVMVESQIRMGMGMAAALQDVEKEGRGPVPGREAVHLREARPPARPARGEVNPLLERVLGRGLRRQVEFMRRHPGIMKLPVILIENDCFHDCIFCKSKPMEPTPMDRVKAFLDEGAPAERRLGLIGNEPLAHPKIHSIIAAARRKGFRRFDVLTSGMPLGDEPLLEKLLEAGVGSFSLPLYSHRAEGHDAITRSGGSFEATLRGIRLAVKAGAEVYLHANLVRQNMDDLADLEAMVRGSLGLPFCIIPTRPKLSNLPYRDLAPSYGEIIARLRGRVTSLVGFPACLCAVVQKEPLLPASMISDLLKLYLLDQAYVKPPDVCGGCTWLRRCNGTYGEILNLYGAASLPGQAALAGPPAPVGNGL